MSQELYSSKEQTEGRLAHEAIDEGTYSTKKKVLMGTEVYTEKNNTSTKVWNSLGI